ncbi:DUF6236 family protein [Agrobacterium tumefaciens]|uniref:Uncharacterized protein n=1 Tax=Agrobacterium tumefaciens TaxID=358 RepID=A0A2L2LI74_AGRTU|nr:DUF6236 family protein [Agrobacterium tumefaciens]AVH44029.1 hypothetical protein At1D1609_39820 [Agrobacterium tumefaciens]NSY97956.1 hypothetical protein [Agrobacterium tumefaciens]
MRGIIITPQIVVSAPETIVLGGTTDPNLVRFWCLFWDQLAYPDQRFFGSDLGGDLDYLESQGVFRRHRVDVKGGNGLQIMVRARTKTFEELEQASPGSWAAASGVGAWEGPELESGRGLRVELVNALPVPDKDVPLDEILKFRERRKDECEALMAYIDECYLSVVASPEKPIAQHLAFEKIARGIREQLEVTTEAGFAHRLYSLAADFNLFAAGVAATGSFAFGASMSTIVGNTILAGASVSVSNILGAVNPKRSSSPFRYLTSYGNEVFR